MQLSLFTYTHRLTIVEKLPELDMRKKYIYCVLDNQRYESVILFLLSGPANPQL